MPERGLFDTTDMISFSVLLIMTFPSHAAAISRIRDVFGVHLLINALYYRPDFGHHLCAHSFLCSLVREPQDPRRFTGLISLVLFLRIVDCPSAFLNTRRVRKRQFCSKNGFRAGFCQARCDSRSIYIGRITHPLSLTLQ
ncbi:hypothetical protein DFJ43DRAFT_339160 [Lentinula guzmanii]|uniref:Uncharacterized protein n=1 Tax=Lentinula guzmanii TaxID=2804957 RepID=A0AA38MZV5_9AGAR|nr:hypothetical protein DFJ43DRAFT_339160 [Lentinula guzmanii]